MVVEKFVLQLEAQLADRDVTIELSEPAKAWLIQHGYDEQMGARPMARVIQEHIKKPLADEVLFGKLKGGGHVRVVVVKDEAVAGVELEKIGFEYLEGPVTPKPEKLPGARKAHAAAQAETWRSQRRVERPGFTRSAGQGVNADRSRIAAGSNRRPFYVASLVRSKRSAFARQFLDTALKLTLFLFAAAQPLVEIGGCRKARRRHCPELEADPAGLPPHHSSKNEQSFCAMVTRISSGSFAVRSNSTQRPPSEILRTTQSIVEPRSLIEATLPRITRSRALWRRSSIGQPP